MRVAKLRVGERPHRPRLQLVEQNWLVEKRLLVVVRAHQSPDASISRAVSASCASPGSHKVGVPRRQKSTTKTSEAARSATGEATLASDDLPADL
jgi:hypothetical protein